jgi:hypothetical protein
MKRCDLFHLTAIGLVSAVLAERAASSAAEALNRHDAR